MCSGGGPGLVRFGEVVSFKGVRMLSLIGRGAATSIVGQSLAVQSSNGPEQT